MLSLRVLGSVCTLSLCIGLGSNKALAVGVPAGTDITNTAQVTYTVGATSTTTSSNSVVVTVAEILDVVVTRQSPLNTAVSASATQQEIVFTVTNSGNGPEAFRLVMNSVIGADRFRSDACHSVYLFRYRRERRSLARRYGVYRRHQRPVAQPRCLRDGSCRE